MKRVLMLIWVCVASAAWAQLQIVVPNGLGSVEGNSDVDDFLSSSSFRMQMVFDASQFPGLPSGPGVTSIVASIAFRIDGASTFDVISAFGGISVSLSTTPRGPDSLSPVFAENVGPDAVTIYSGAGSFGGGYIAGQSPQPFGQTIPSSGHFNYSPSRGNLLVDIIAGSGQVLFPGALDAQLSNGDSVSRVFANAAGATAGNADTLGLVTRFNIAVIPEPATWLIAVTGFSLLAIFRRR